MHRLPTVSVEYKGKTYTKQLTALDCETLCKSGMQGWKKLLMSIHFRKELNINTPLMLQTGFANEMMNGNLLSQCDEESDS